ncbi:MAG: 1,4-alpha-glucan branching enzyme, partial [Comamonadaceae bacterium]
NLTPVARHGYRIGVPGDAARWREAVNTDAAIYGGSGAGNGGGANTESHPSHGHARSLVLTLPPLSTLFLVEELPSES